jgi:hypothetical protein
LTGPILPFGALYSAVDIQAEFWQLVMVGAKMFVVMTHGEHPAATSSGLQISGPPP